MDDSQLPPESIEKPIEEMPTHTEEDLLDMFLLSENVAEGLDDGLLVKIGDTCVEEYQIDKESRSAWEKRMREALELARQVKSNKTWAGEKVSNVKYPLISTACIQFQSRAYGNIVKGEDYVKIKVTGQDVDNAKAQRAERVRVHMNNQLSDENVGWEDEMDQLLMALPLLGTGFKKTYRNLIDNTNNSEYVSAEDLIVHYWSKSLEKAARVTQVIELTQNQYLEYVRSGQWLDVGIENLSPDISEEEQSKKNPDANDTEAGYVFLEQHRWWDLDGDGYKEPYIMTVHKATQRVVRIVARYETSGVIRNDDGQIVKIIPVQYYTQYRFFPDFNANFYCMGFGVLLSPINETINSLINQLLDAGSLQNRQSGFISRGIRLTKSGASGSVRFKTGEWKYVKSAGDDLRKSILPLPAHEPSATLFSLLGLLLEASKELASQAEVLSGEQKQPNVPATTTLALIEQGLKVFSGIYKRIHRALKKEFVKMCRMNMLFTTEEEYNRVIDDPENPKWDPRLDYDLKDMDIGPISSTADVSDVQKLIKAQALMEVAGRGLDDMEILRRYLDALQVENPEGLFPKEQPPDPKIELAKQQLAIEMAKIQQGERELDLKEREVMIKDSEAYYKMVKLHADAVKSIALAEAAEKGPQIEQYKAEIDHLGKVVDSYKTQMELDLRKKEIAQNARQQRTQ